MCRVGRVTGLGGVGKTQLAAHYAYTHHGEYDAVLWAGADSPENAAAAIDSGAAAAVLEKVTEITKG